MRKMLAELKNNENSEASICWWYTQEIKEECFKIIDNDCKN